MKRELTRADRTVVWQPNQAVSDLIHLDAYRHAAVFLSGTLLSNAMQILVRDPLSPNDAPVFELLLTTAGVLYSQTASAKGWLPIAPDAAHMLTEFKLSMTSAPSASAVTRASLIALG